MIGKVQRNNNNKPINSYNPIPIIQKYIMWLIGLYVASVRSRHKMGAVRLVRYDRFLGNSGDEWNKNKLEDETLLSYIIPS